MLITNTLESICDLTTFAGAHHCDQVRPHHSYVIGSSVSLKVLQ